MTQESHNTTQFVCLFVLTDNEVGCLLCAQAMQVAVRKPTKGTLVTLWLDEYFAVYKNKVESKG